ncbi:DUF6233 domain-containing protein [Streptomyces sp. NPDC006289]|uniref:DUF6233 domain-containing protein n=1 Tax=Streptomyces sp. NPDC006289 TaxID=3156744 RepID=UPI00339DD91F
MRPGRSSPSAPPRQPCLPHRGGCATYPDQVGLVSREDAMVAPADADIEPCDICRPQTGLLS